MISTDRFCLNRKAAPGVKLDETLEMISSIGVNNIELRNDLYGDPDNSSIMDSMSNSDVKIALNKNGVVIKTINAIGNMDKRSMVKENIESLTEMLEMTKNLDLKNFVFCPVRSTEDKRTSDEKKAEAIANVKDYSKVLKKYGVNGLIEPLGFTDSSLRTPWEGQAIIDEAGVDNFKLVADSFHYYLANITDKQFNEKVNIDYIGLVHLSSVFANKKREELDDQDRYMLGQDDVMQSAELAQKIEARGYKGIYAFEPFSDDLKEWDVTKAKEELENSIKLVRDAANTLV
ncbi:sugar phosphate isomerase/epimerase family protein [Companilactobacillus baiquanensis]|uniref:Sugar phosphate isomerase/epimerase family protein n=1 Tax=Companilactobacillus baiquanensis TaxID=2486005 RepID=A0ABW1UYQ8_9LACO|nr:TIM barrel protein [Companilactobacillus baiquanensis]